MLQSTNDKAKVVEVYQDREVQNPEVQDREARDRDLMLASLPYPRTGGNGNR
jgi:hypothetical protein